MKSIARLLISLLLFSSAYAQNCTAELANYLTIQSQPQSVELYLQQTAMFVAGVEYPDSVAFQWYYNETPIDGAVDDTLEIPFVNYGFEGQYFCEVSNACGTVSTDTVSLKIRIKEPSAPSDETELRYFTGGGSDAFAYAYNVSTDADMNSYTIGTVSDTIQFDCIDSTLQLVTLVDSGDFYQHDIYVVKHSATHDLQWALQIGGNANEFGGDIVTDSKGDSYLCFYYDSQMQLRVKGDMQTLHPVGESGESVAFIKIDPDGNVLWANAFASSRWSVRPKLAITETDQILLLGGYDRDGADLDFSAGEYLVGNNTTEGTFVAAYDAAGSLEWAHSFDGGAEFGEHVEFKFLSINKTRRTVVAAATLNGSMSFEMNGERVDTAFAGYTRYFFLEMDLGSGEITDFVTSKVGLNALFDISHDPRGNMLLLLRNGSEAADYSLRPEDSYVLPESSYRYQTHMLRYDPDYMVDTSITFVAATNSECKKIFTDDYSNIYISLFSGYTYETSLLGSDARTLPYGGHLIAFDYGFKLLWDKHIYSKSTASYYDAEIMNNNQVVTCGLYQAENSHINPDDHSVVIPEDSYYSSFYLSIPFEENINEFPCQDYSVNLGIDSIRCQGQTLTLKPINYPPGVANYKWSTGETSRFITVAADSTYYVTVSGVDVCAESVDSISVSSVDVSVTISPDQLEVSPNSNFMLEAVAEDQNLEYTYRWQSAEKITDAFDQYVQIQAPASGDFNVGVLASDKQSGCSALQTKQVTVTSAGADVTAINVLADSMNLAIGHSKKIYVVTDPLTADLNSLIWESSDESVAKVENGNVYGQTAGVASIMVKTADGTVSDTVTVTVAKPVLVQSFMLPKTCALPSGASKQLHAVVYPSSAWVESYEWSSSNPSCVRVTDEGLLYGMATGVATVTVKAVGTGFAATCIVSVTGTDVAAEGILLPERMQAEAGDYFMMPVMLTPSSATSVNLDWTSGDQNVALVDPSGKVELVGAGITTITATITGTEQSSSCQLIVGESLAPVIKALPNVYMTLSSESLNIDLTAYISDDETAVENLKIERSATQNVFTGLSGTTLFVNLNDKSAVGYERVVLTVEDEEGLVSKRAFGIYVTDENNSPVNKEFDTELPELSFGPDAEKISFDLGEYYSENASFTSVSADSTDQLAVAVAGSVVTVSLIDAAWTGTDTVMVKIITSEGNTRMKPLVVSRSFSPNKAPVVLDIPVQRSNDTVGFKMVNLNMFVRDDYTLPQNIRWSVQPGQNVRAEIVNNVFRAEVLDPYWSGAEYLVLIAKDEAGLETSHAVKVAVQSSLQPPYSLPLTFTAVAERSFVTPGQVIDLWVNLFAPSVGAVDYVWEIAGADFAGDVNIGATVAVSFAQPGVYMVKLTAVSSDNSITQTYDAFVHVLGIYPRGSAICSGESVDFTVFGSDIETLLWSTGDTTKSVTVSPEASTDYSVTIITKRFGIPFVFTDEVSVQVGVPVYLGADTSICYGTSYELYPENYETYTWTYNGSSVEGDSLTVDATGFYNITVTDAFGCETSDELVVQSVLPLPVVQLEGAPSICLEDTLLLDAGDFANYLWSNGSTSRQLEAAETDLYSVTVTDENGCVNSADFDLFVQEPFNEPIGVATAADNSDFVLVSWERTAGKGTDHYELYRLELNDTVPVASVPFDSLSVVVDTAVNINQQSYSYMLVTVDTCGHRSAYSPEHQTVYLTASPEVNSGGVALEWTQYVGAEVEGYRIYQSSNGTLAEIGTARVSESKFTVLHHTNGATYRVAADVPEVNPAVLKSQSGPFSQSMSNLSEAVLVDQIAETGVKMLLYPNPSNGLFGVVLSGVSAECSIQIVSAQGTPVYTANHVVDGTQLLSVDIQNQAAGMYTLLLKIEGQIISKEIVKY